MKLSPAANYISPFKKGGAARGLLSCIVKRRYTTNRLPGNGCCVLSTRRAANGRRM